MRRKNSNNDDDDYYYSRHYNNCRLSLSFLLEWTLIVTDTCDYYTPSNEYSESIATLTLPNSTKLHNRKACSLQCLFSLVTKDS